MSVSHICPPIQKSYEILHKHRHCNRIRRLVGGVPDQIRKEEKRQNSIDPRRSGCKLLRSCASAEVSDWLYSELPARMHKKAQ